VGRRKTIDREMVLASAEDVVAERGPAGLTIDAVAQAAGITKGGVQSCFGTKEALIEAMLARWGGMYSQQVEELVGPSATPMDLLKAHVSITGGEDEGSAARSAALIASLLQTPGHLGWVNEWYEERAAILAALDETHGAKGRLAFFATEGAFLLRYFGLMKMTNAQWTRHFADIDDLLR